MRYDGPIRSRRRSGARISPWLILALPLIVGAAMIGGWSWLADHQARREAAAAAAQSERLREGADERARASAAHYAAERARSVRALGYFRGPDGPRLVVDSDPGDLAAATERLCELARGFTRDELRNANLDIVLGARGLPTRVLGRVRCK